MNTESAHINGEDFTESKNFIRALARGLAVIESMATDTKGATLATLATRCSLDRATARRILLTLNELGYVRSEGNRFFLAPRALSLGYAYLSAFPFWEIAKPLMKHLVDQLQESCSAATLDGAYAVYVARIRSNERIVDVSRTIGSRVPAYCTSLGRVLLAAEPVEVQKKALQAIPLVANTDQTVVDKKELLKILVEVKKQGWAIVDGELEPGLRSIAVPVMNSRGHVIAGLNISVQAGKVEASDMIDRYLAPLEEAAKALTSAFTQRDL